MSCGKSELCIFDSAFPQIAVNYSHFEEYYPVNSIAGTSTANLEFNITGSNTDYLDLNDTLLCLELKTVKHNDADLVDGDGAVTPSNYLFQTLFNEATLIFNTILVEGGDKMYCHKALLDVLLNYNSDTKATNLASIGVGDDAFRVALAKNSKPFTLCGSLQFDFFDQPKYLIPGVNVNIKLHRNANKLILHAATPATKPKLQYLSAKLLVRKVKVEPSVLMGHQLGLNKRNAKYPIQQTKVVTYSVGVGSLGFNKDQVFGDVRLPKFVLVTFQGSTKFSGAYDEHFPTFDHLKVTNMTLSRGSDFNECYTQDFTVADSHAASYVTSMIRNMGHLDKNLNNSITMDTFKSTYPFFTFVLSPDFVIDQAQLPSQGNLRIDIKFSTALEKAANIILYAIFDNEIQINKNRTVLI